jgi:hypothetical protein
VRQFKGEVKGDGQECPSHTCVLTDMGAFLAAVDGCIGAAGWVGIDPEIISPKK